jgi:hypothetical protein
MRRLRARMRKFRYVRKIESEDTIPLATHCERVRSEPSIEEPRPRFMIDRNKDPSYMALFSIESRHQRSVENGESKSARLLKVKSDQALAFEHKYFSTMANVERKKLQVLRYKMMESSSGPVSFGKSEKQSRWFEILTHLSVMREMKERIEYKKSGGSSKDIMDMARDMSEEELAKKSATSYAMRQAKQLIDIDRDPESRKFVILMQATLLSKARIKKRKKNVAVVWDRLKAWSSGGQLVMGARKFTQKVRAIQDWCRDRIDAMRKVRDDVRRRFRIVEGMVMLEKKEEKEGEGADKKKNATRGSMKKSATEAEDGPRKSQVDPVEGSNAKGGPRRSITRQPTAMTGPARRRISLSDEPVEEKVMNKFLRLELRAARHLSLMKKAEWRVNLDAYYDEVVTWRINKQACLLMGKSKLEIRVECPMPIRPPYKAHVPTDDELYEWVKRCREDPSKISPRPVAGKRIPVEMKAKDDEATAFNAQLEAKATKEAAGKRLGLSPRDYLPKVSGVDEERSWEVFI